MAGTRNVVRESLPASVCASAKAHVVKAIAVGKIPR